MKIKNLLPLLLLFITFTSCVERVERIVTKETSKTSSSVSPKFSVEKETVKSRISAIIPAEQISFAHSNTKTTGEEGYSSLTVEIQPDSLPSNLLAFYRMTDEIQSAVESGISNMDEYQKLEIVIRQTLEENGAQHTQSYKKEIDL
ncbi:hypothetical protein HC174_05685 [Salinimicrobium sp. CDJ15-81-2]|nr:hypothetical protein [Salinimicrobium nanhaiense]